MFGRKNDSRSIKVDPNMLEYQYLFVQSKNAITSFQDHNLDEGTTETTTIYKCNFVPINIIHMVIFFYSPYLLPLALPNFHHEWKMVILNVKIIYIWINLVMLMSFHIPLGGDFVQHTSIQLLILILYLFKEVVEEIVNLIFISFIENWECVCSNKTFGQNIYLFQQSSIPWIIN